VESGQRLHRIEGYAASLFDLDWNPDGRLWVSVGYDNRIGLWDPATGVCLEVLKVPDAADTIFLGVAWSPDGPLSSGVWRLSAWRACVGYDIPYSSLGRADTADFAPSDRVEFRWDTVSRWGDEDQVYVWDATGGTLLLWLTGHEGGPERGLETCWQVAGLRWWWKKGSGTGRVGSRERRAGAILYRPYRCVLFGGLESEWGNTYQWRRGWVTLLVRSAERPSGNGTGPQGEP
jgi:hypothetical protein